MIGLINELLSLHELFFALISCVWVGSQIVKKDGFKVHQMISCHYLGEGQSVPETLQPINCKLAFSWSRPHYNLHSIFFFNSSIISRWWDLTLSLVALIQLSERWIRARLFAKKTSKTQTLHVTVYFHTPLEEISRVATPDFDFKVSWIRLMLKLPYLYLFEWFFQKYL